jgi:hypothetical protein
LTDLGFEVSGHDAIEFALFPLPALIPMVAQTVIGAGLNPIGTGHVLMSGDLCGTRIDEAICMRDTVVSESALRALFAFETIETIEHQKASPREDQRRIVGLSIESGVLCNATAFVGFSPRAVQRDIDHALSLLECSNGPAICHQAIICDELTQLSSCFSYRGEVRHSAEFCREKKSSGGIVGFFSDLFSGFRHTEAPPPAAAPPPRAAAPPQPAAASRLPNISPMREVAAPVPMPHTVPGSIPRAPVSDGLNDRMLGLVNLQGFGGFWADGQDVCRVTGVNIECPTDLEDQPARFATALAIAILRKQFGELRSQWVMIERKGLQWLSGQIGDAEALICRLFSLL